MSESLPALIRAGHPLIGIETTDEPAAIAHVREAAEELGRPFLRWSATAGLTGPPPPSNRREHAIPGPLSKTGDLKAALKQRRAVAGAILDDHALTAEDLPRLADAKKRLVASTGCLESITADFAPEDLGGLARLKDWLRGRRGGFDAKAEAFGLEPPRGVLMLGVPGCGKSLCAKVVAADWGLPLLRLDPGVLYQKYIGASETRLREALRQAEATAPVVLWVDEIEKAFASAGGGGGSDGGLSRRMFGTLLSWMQDHRHPIFLVATANDLSALPPELMRKGRFDEVFFVDLPAEGARRAILAVHLRRRGRDPEKFDLDRLAEASAGFSGAELEQAVVTALFAAYREGGADAELTDDQIAAALADTKPLSVLNAEKIAGLQAWAAERCVPAD